MALCVTVARIVSCFVKQLADVAQIEFQAQAFAITD